MTAQAPGVEEVAEVVHRLAVLSAAGLAPAGAWRFAGERAGGHGIAVAAAAAEAASRGRAVAGAIEHAAVGAQRESWLAVAAAWQVATTAGAPLAATLRGLADSFRMLGELEREAQASLAGPKATARVVMLLPAVGVAFGALLGFGTLRVLLATVPGLVCLGLGALLLFAAARWNRRLLRAATPARRAPGLSAELTAIAMAGGGSLPRAREIVAAALVRYPVDDADERAAVDDVLDLAHRAGVPSVELLRALAAERRTRARFEARAATAALGVRLLGPLGVCVLPAFMLVGVVPVLLSVISTTVTGLS